MAKKKPFPRLIDSLNNAPDYARLGSGDAEASWLSLVESFKTQRILPPRHQRSPDTWNDTKRALFIARLKSGYRPIGQILTYQIGPDEASPTYLNDGLQRLTACIKLLSDPGKFGMVTEEAEQILRVRKVSVAHRYYESHAQAMTDFQLVNQGSPMTAKDFYHGILAYMDHYDEVWKKLLYNIHHVMTVASARILTARSLRDAQKDQEHQKLLRHDYLLLVRFLSKDSSLPNEPVNNKPVSVDDLLNENSIEARLKNCLTTLGAEQTEKQIGMFNDMIERETALIQQAWFDIKGDIGARIAQAPYRWLLEIAIWKRFNSVPTEVWRDFIYKLLDKSSGTGKIPIPSKSGQDYTLSLGNARRLKDVCEAIGSEMHKVSERKRERPKDGAGPGFDSHHIAPFSKHGEGPTVLVPAGLNRAMGNREQQEDAQLNK